MSGFPFGDGDWSRVREAARAVLNAALAEDAPLHAALLEELRLVLAELRAKYGAHPVLSETEADFSGDPAEQRRLYEAAVREAERAGLVTYSIRVSLARLLLDEFAEPDRALKELLACGPELAAHADESDRREWSELLARCRQENHDRPR